MPPTNPPDLEAIDAPYQGMGRSGDWHLDCLKFHQLITKDWPALRDELLAARLKVVELEKENDFMRTRLAESDKDCVYCSLPKSDLPKCASGFPGCARADDLFHCDELTRRDEKSKAEGAAEWIRGYMRGIAEGPEDPYVRAALVELQKHLDGMNGSAEAERLRTK